MRACTCTACVPTLQLLAVVGVGIAGQPGQEAGDVGLADPAPPPVPRHAVLLPLLLPHLVTTQQGVRVRGA
jgi:hypothetical protein